MKFLNVYLGDFIGVMNEQYYYIRLKLTINYL